ncbi:3-oxoacyl-[acyl-carrier-protein] synthase III C-terminal domain-containing protein [Paenibacillus sp. S-38]|uniref:3-oxoacyl-[acyl-carrier-protein] synthase III C-terminal domain-containing protein n=1 Tax=Paenibacillus sp. S-38 TaxID=3416710 RepID=UPI003CF9507A
MYDEELCDQDRRLEWLPFTPENAIGKAHLAIEQLLQQHGLSKSDVRKYFISQFSKKSLEVLSGLLKEDPAKFKFVGDAHGYTGTSSPLLAFAKSIEDHDIEREDVVVFWSVGEGITSCSVIYRY